MIGGEKQYIMPAIQVVVLDCLCTSFNSCSVVSGRLNTKKADFTVGLFYYTITL